MKIAMLGFTLMSQPQITVGLISDTHGLLRDEAVRQLEGSDVIIHAGDVGDPEILDRLRKIAPVAAVRGNVDMGDWADKLPSDVLVEAGSTLIYVLHSIDDLKVNLAAGGIQVVVFGHSHKPEERSESGVLYINPGSAGPRRFKLPISLARLTISVGSRKVTFIDLDAHAA
jgi:putative phosphoesterase